MSTGEMLQHAAVPVSSHHVIAPILLHDITGSQAYLLGSALVAGLGVLTPEGDDRRLLVLKLLGAVMQPRVRNLVMPRDLVPVLALLNLRHGRQAE
jgi:hypothetical protein